MGTTAHVDTFARDSLPPREMWPELLFDLPELRYPEQLNCAVELLDRATDSGGAERPAIYAPVGDGRTLLGYGQLRSLANQIAHVLRDELGLVPGNRVLLRSPNNAMLAACVFAVWKAGGIVVTAMRKTHPGELRQIIDKAEIDFALCDVRLKDEFDTAGVQRPGRTVYFGAGNADSLEVLLAAKPVQFDNVRTMAEDIAMIAFTSGTTGVPKAALHFHRDVMALCDCWPRSVLKPRGDDIFCGTPMLTSAYGLGVMLCIPLRFGASTVLVEELAPQRLLQTIQDFRCTICAAGPTFYRQMASLADYFDIGSLRIAISSGAVLADSARTVFREASGIELIDSLASTEMMQTFISHTPRRARRGATGYAVPGFTAAILDDDGRVCPPNVTGRLAVKGPTGCLYLDDTHQSLCVQGGWNLTGDVYSMDSDGYFYFQGGSSDTIVSAGDVIAGLEVEAVLLDHQAVADCGVIGIPDELRGQLVAAFVVLEPGFVAGAQLVTDLQNYVKASIASHKYPRRIEFVSTLPRTDAGALRRFRLLELAAASGGA